MDEKSERVTQNIALLTEMGCRFSLMPISENMLSHSIADANSSLRDLLVEGRIHDYAKQEFGPEYKIQLPTIYLAYKSLDDGLSTLYRANKRGDCRIWFGPFARKYASPNDKLAIFASDNKLYLLNISQYSIKRALNSDFGNPIKDFLSNKSDYSQF